MRDASRPQSTVVDCRSRARTALAGVRVLAGVLAVAMSGAACGLKGSLTLPETPRNVVIRPGPGGETAPPTAPAPEAERLPPPELPPDTRGNTRD